MVIVVSGEKYSQSQILSPNILNNSIHSMKKMESEQYNKIFKFLSTQQLPWI
jgi:hypothetical protein